MNTTTFVGSLPDLIDQNQFFLAFVQMYTLIIKPTADVI